MNFELSRAGTYSAIRSYMGRDGAEAEVSETPPDAMLDERFAKAFEVSPLPQSMVRARDGVFVAVNSAFERGFGYSRHEVIGRRSEELGLYADPQERARVAREVEESGQVTDREVVMRTKSGAIRTVVLSIIIIDVGGEPTVLSVGHDITERKAAEEALRASESRFAQAFALTPLATTIVRSADRTFTAVNDAYVRLFGYSAEEVIGHRAEEFPFFADPSTPGVLNSMLVAEGAIREFPAVVLTRTGERREVLLTIERIVIDGEASTYSIIQDISERKRNEAALRQS